MLVVLVTAVESHREHYGGRLQLSAVVVIVMVSIVVTILVCYNTQLYQSADVVNIVYSGQL